MIDVLLGVIPNAIWAATGGIAVWLWQKYRTHALRQRLRNYEQERGSREAVLIVSAREDIHEAVQAQLARDKHEGLIEYKVHKNGSFSDQEKDWLNFVGEIKKEVKKIREDGVSRVHLFTHVPVVMGTFLGALLDNGPEVVVYHFFGGVYRPIGRICHETVYGV